MRRDIVQNYSIKMKHRADSNRPRTGGWAALGIALAGKQLWVMRVLTTEAFSPSPAGRRHHRPPLQVGRSP